jgi:ankyrin repeat protein
MKLIRSFFLMSLVCSNAATATLVHTAIDADLRGNAFKVIVKADPNIRAVFGRSRDTYLHYAAAKDRSAQILALLETRLKKSLTKTNALKQTAIEIAIVEGNDGAFMALLSHTKDPDFRVANQYGWTLAHLAARFNRSGMLIELKRRGANMNAYDNSQEAWTPLDVALDAGAMGAVQTLQDMGGFKNRV